MPRPHPFEQTESFCTYIIPAALAYYVAAVLVILPRTLPIRLALLPVKLWLLFRAATSVDIVAAYGDPSYGILDYFLGVSERNNAS